jgi:hypothetical protein
MNPTTTATRLRTLTTSFTAVCHLSRSRRWQVWPERMAEHLDWALEMADWHFLLACKDGVLYRLPLPRGVLAACLYQQ